MTHVLRIPGHVPTKKNNYRATQRANGKSGFYMDDDKRAYVEALRMHVRVAWMQRRPLSSAVIHMRFYVRDGRSDLDGKFTTMQDVLVKEGVLANDSIARVKRFSAEALYDANERVEVRLREVS